jgi:cytochrome c-type biogenesis protein CcmF
MLILNNLFLVTGLAAVLVGTLYPLILEAVAGKTISVGGPFFNLTFGALMTPLLVLIPFGPFMAWKRGDLVAVTQRLAAAIVIAVLGGILVLAFSGWSISLAPLGILLGFWVAFGALAELVDRTKLGRIAPRESWRRLTGLPQTAFSTAIAHFGVGISVIGIVATSAWSGELVTTLSPGQTATLAGYSVHFDGLDETPGPNYTAERGLFTLTDPGGGTRTAAAEKRVYTVSQQPTTQASINTYGFSQLYLQLGEKGQGNAYVVRLWYKPFVTFIWFGAILMAFAGFLSLSDRRLRVGAPRPRQVPATAPLPEAAE